MAAALLAAANRLILTATESPVGARRRLHTFARTMKNGFPGGCGIPSVWAVAIYSLASQKAVVGASVKAYSRNAPSAAATPHS